MQDTKFVDQQSAQGKVNAHMIQLFDKQAYSLPAWHLLYEVVREAQVDPSNIKTHKYVNKLYWALKDLFKTEYSSLNEFTGIDEATHSITTVEKRCYAAKVGTVQMQSVTQQLEPDAFNRLCLGKSLAELNELSTVLSYSKLDSYRKKRSLDATLEDEQDDSISIVDEVIASWGYEEGLEKKIDNLFKPVLDLNWPRLSFEQFTKEVYPTQSKPVTSTPGPVSASEGKPKRVNGEAKEKRDRLLTKYQKYIKEGYRHDALIKRLLLDFRIDYKNYQQNNKSKGLKRDLKRAIAENNKEQLIKNVK